MNARLKPSSESDALSAAANRAVLRAAGVFTLNIVGGAGCGKTSLIKATVERRSLDLRVGVITADPETRRDAERLVGCAERVVQVETGPEGVLGPGHLRPAIARFDLRRLDLLLIENISSLIGPAQFDLGQDAVASVFSVAAGDDKAAKYPAIVRMSDVVVLNKTDLLGVVLFDMKAFRRDVGGLNSKAGVIEVSTLRGDGLDTWLEWLGRRQRAARDVRSVVG